MTIDEFRQQRIEGREVLFKKIIETFKSLNPVAIHLFGSGTTNFKDEFSDIDVWITFEDEEISKVLKNLTKILNSVDPVLVRHHSNTWSPVGGSGDSVIHDTKSGIFIVDYYISKRSETILKQDSKHLYGDDSLKRGSMKIEELKLNMNIDKNIKDQHTLKKDTNLFICLIFISIKGIIRKWEGDDFVNILKLVHKSFRERYKNLKSRQINLSFKSDYRLLSDLYKLANKSQRRAILKIRKYAKQVEKLYQS